MTDADSALRKKIMAIQGDTKLTAQQKGQAMQALMSSNWDAGNNASNGDLSSIQGYFFAFLRKSIRFKVKPVARHPAGSLAFHRGQSG